MSDNAPYQRHSDTSREAAEAKDADRVRKETERLKVLLRLRESSDGATDDELQLALGMDGNTERPRRVELVNLGLVCDSGRTRPTRKNRAAVVWVATTDPQPIIVQLALFE